MQFEVELVRHFCRNGATVLVSSLQRVSAFGVHATVILEHIDGIAQNYAQVIHHNYKRMLCMHVVVRRT
jgi:RNase P subunit RPR2